MPRITDEILQSVDIVEVIGRYVQLKRAGSNFSGKCPFHNEKTPSFMVSPQKQIFKCFGCGVGGDVITFIKEFERVDFRDAVKILAKDANIDLAQYEKNYEKYEEMNQGKEKIKRLHKLAQDFFVKSLQGNKEAIAYLKKQRKLSDDTIKTFGIGYAPNSHYDLLQKLRTKGFKDADLLEASLVKQGQSGDVFSFFRHRITFPIYDTMRNVVAFTARILDPNDKPKYLNSSEHPAFDKSKTLYGLHIVKKHIKEFGYIIVVEGQMDVIALHQLGYPVAVATSGTAITADHIKTLKRYTDKLYFLFDNDEAGQKATLRALKIAYQHDVFPKLLNLPPKYKDVDELGQEKNGKEQFDILLKEAIDAFLSIYKKLRTDMDMGSPVDKQRLMNTMFELIVGLPNPSTQIHYLSILAEEIGQSYEVMSAQYQQYVSTDGKFSIRQQQKKKKNTNIYQLQREDIVASLFDIEFMKSLLGDSDYSQKLLALGNKVKTILSESPLAIQGAPEQQQEAQLWREKELSETKDEDKPNVIRKIITPTLKNYIQQIRKLPDVSAEYKQEVFEMVRSVS